MRVGLTQLSNLKFQVSRHELAAGFEDLHNTIATFAARKGRGKSAIRLLH